MNLLLKLLVIFFCLISFSSLYATADAKEVSITLDLKANVKAVKNALNNSVMYKKKWTCRRDCDPNGPCKDFETTEVKVGSVQMCVGMRMRHARGS